MQEPVVQFVDPEDEGPHRAAQGFRRRLKAVFLDLDHIANFIDQQADRAVLGAHHDIHGQHVRRAGRQFKPPPQIDRRDNLPPQVDEPADHRRRQRNLRHVERADDFLHALQFHAEQKLVQIKSAKL